MSFIYSAQLDPDKNEWIRRALVAHGEDPDVPFTKAGSYRFDDPAGELGLEVMLVRVGGADDGRLVQAPLSYRSAARDGATVLLTAEHSVLGTRWIHDALTDPEAREVLRRGVAGELAQEVLEVHNEHGVRTGTRQPDMTVTAVGTGPAAGELDMPYELDPADTADGGRALVAEGDGFSGLVVARLV